MATMQAMEVWVLRAANGDYVVSDDQDMLNELFEEHVGPLNEAAQPFQLFKATITAPLPEPIEVSGTVEIAPQVGELKAVSAG